MILKTGDWYDSGIIMWSAKQLTAYFKTFYGAMINFCIAQVMHTAFFQYVQGGCVFNVGCGRDPVELKML